MGIFSGMSEAKYSEGGIYLLDGNYVLQIEALKSGTNRQKVDYFVAECRILQSTNPERKPGTIVSWWVGIKVDTPALADVRRFLAEAGESDDADVDDQAAEMAVSEEQPFKGIVLRASATTKLTEKRKVPFTKVIWKLFEGTEGDVMALRKACGL